jgi:hypothetical protein
MNAMAVYGVQKQYGDLAVALTYLRRPERLRLLPRKMPATRQRQRVPVIRVTMGNRLTGHWQALAVGWVEIDGIKRMSWRAHPTNDQNQSVP